MNNLITTQFMDTPVTVIDDKGKKWMTADDIGRCLGYNEANAGQGVRNLYNRHADEFTDADTCQINLIWQGQTRELRVFSDTGSMKLGFFANTARAKDFRTWAAQVLAARAAESTGISSPAFDIMARNMAKLADGMDTLLRQNNRTDRYVALLEINQRGHGRVTEQVRQQVFELYGQGMPQASIGRMLRISPSTVNQLIKGTYIASQHFGALSYADHKKALEALIEQQLAEAKLEADC